MSTYCQELKEKIINTDPFFIVKKENMSGGLIISKKAIDEIPSDKRISEKLDDDNSFNVYAASSDKMNDSYSWFSIRKEEFLFSVNIDVFEEFFPNCKVILEDQ